MTNSACRAAVSTSSGRCKYIAAFNQPGQDQHTLPIAKHARPLIQYVRRYRRARFRLQVRQRRLEFRAGSWRTNGSSANIRRSSPAGSVLTAVRKTARAIPGTGTARLHRRTYQIGDDFIQAQAGAGLFAALSINSTACLMSFLANQFLKMLFGGGCAE